MSESGPSILLSTPKRKNDPPTTTELTWTDEGRVDCVLPLWATPRPYFWILRVEFLVLFFSTGLDGIIFHWGEDRMFCFCESTKDEGFLHLAVIGQIYSLHLSVQVNLLREDQAEQFLISA